MLVLPHSSLVEMNDASLDSLIPKIEFLDVLSLFVFLCPKFTLILDGINEKAELAILSKKLILTIASCLHNFLDFLGVEYFVLFVEVELVGHGLHDLLHFVCH